MPSRGSKAAGTQILSIAERNWAERTRSGVDCALTTGTSELIQNWVHALPASRPSDPVIASTPERITGSQTNAAGGDRIWRATIA
ncbi:hypothetical protein D3C72_2247190 [compost metagenome]